MQASKELAHKNEFHYRFSSVNLKGIALFTDKAEAGGRTEIGRDLQKRAI